MHIYFGKTVYQLGINNVTLTNVDSFLLKCYRYLKIMLIHSRAIYKLWMLKNKLYFDFSEEAFECYREKLPENIQVVWERSGSFIVGRIYAEGEQFMTQAKSADEFIEMVNDTLYAAYEIPVAYIPYLGGLNRFKPPVEAYEKLNDAAVHKSNISLKHNVKQVVPAA